MIQSGTPQGNFSSHTKKIKVSIKLFIEGTVGNIYACNKEQLYILLYYQNMKHLINQISFTFYSTEITTKK